jgi:hypothetical protein
MMKSRTMRLLWFWGGVLLVVSKIIKKYKTMSPTRG